MATSFSADSRGKSGSAHEEPPIVMATVLPESAFQQVIIDDEEDIIDAQETTPLVTLYSSITSYSIPGDGLATDDGIEDIIPQGVFRDWWFGLLFYLQLCSMVFFSCWYSPRGYEKIDLLLNYTFIRERMEAESDDMTPENWEEFDSFVTQIGDYIEVYLIRIVVWSILPSALIGFVWVHMSVLVLPFISFLIVKASLVLTMALAICLLSVWLALSPTLGSFILGTTICCAVAYYVHLVWPMIPFAAVNLKVAANGINANMGTHLWAFFSCMLGVLWLIFWLWGTVGIMSYMDEQCSNNHHAEMAGDSLEPVNGTVALPDAKRWLKSNDMKDEDVPNCGQGSVFLLLLLSNYWTYMVLMNTVEVTVAGVMATWCYDKEAASGCCSPAVASSLYRSVTYSFGSICLGSLLQSIVQALRKVMPDRSRVNSGDQCCGLCFCVVECFGRVLENVLDYFHQWAFVFVGIYGYGYVESGRKVLELFVANGWSSIASERLASYVTGCITFTVGVITGLSTWMVTILANTVHVERQDGDIMMNYVYGPVPQWVSIFIGFFIGAVIASVMMSVVRGAANTLIVCFADSPVRLGENHPELTTEIVDAWAAAFPSSVQKISSDDSMN